MRENSWIPTEAVVAALAADPASAVAAAVARLAGRTRWLSYGWPHLVCVLRGADRAAVAAWDGDAVEAALDRARADPATACPHAGARARQTVRTALLNAKLSPELDPDGIFRSHLRFVSRAFLDAHPACWRLPAAFAVWLRRWPDPTERPLLCEIAQRCVLDAEASASAGRPRRLDRVRAGRTKHVMNVLAELRRYGAADRGGGLRDRFLAVTAPSGALDLLARTIAARQRHRGRRTRLPAELENHRARTTLQDFQTLVRAGVFESQGVPCDTVLSWTALRRRMIELERADPVRYAAEERVAALRSEPALTAADVDALYAACRTRREAAVLGLLAESAFRAGALTNARLDDVWDLNRNEVRPVIHLLEKNSRIRANVPNARLRAALRAYVLEERGTDTARTEWLFPHRFYPAQRSTRLALQVVRALCTRTGLAVTVTPHTFRRYVVNTAMRAGNRLHRTPVSWKRRPAREAVQRWLGHSSATTTMRHYWTDPMAELDVAVLGSSSPVSPPPPPPSAEGGSDGRLAAQLVEAVAEIRRLRACLGVVDAAQPAAADAEADRRSNATGPDSLPEPWWR